MLLLHCTSDPKGTPFNGPGSGPLKISKTMAILCQKHSVTVCTQIREKTEQDDTSGGHIDNQHSVFLIFIYLTCC